MISSQEFSTDPNFMAQYMPGIARAGVIVNPAFPSLESNENMQTLRPSSALSGLMPFAVGGSLLGESSVEQQDASYNPPQQRSDHVTELRLDTKGQMPIYKDPAIDWEGSRSRPQSRPLFREDEVLREELNDPLLKKLEQLKEIQQQKQEQLKQQQMEQLQKLMEEQKMLLNLVSRQPSYSEHDQQNLISGHLGGSKSQNSLSRLMSPVSGNISRDSMHKKQELGKNNRSPSRPPSVLVQELSPDRSKTLEDLLKEEDSEDYTGDECETDDSSNSEDLSRVLRDEQLDKNNVESDNAGERPILSDMKERKRSFEELLEEQMRIEEQRLQQTKLQQSAEEQTKRNTIVKRPFLRRGEGLARFKNPKRNKTVPQKASEVPGSETVSEIAVPEKVDKGQVQRKIAPFGKGQVSENSSGAAKMTIQPAREKPEAIQKKLVLKNHNAKHSTSVATSGQPQNKSTVSGRSSVTLERKPVLDIDKENVYDTKSTEASDKRNAKVDDSGKDCPLPSDLYSKSANPAELSFEVSFQKRQVHLDKEKQKENYELDEFLLLEQAAEDISFSSNSSFVQKLLDQDYQLDNGHRRLSSTPVKSAEKQQEKAASGARNANSGKINQKMEEFGSRLKNPSVPSPVRFGQHSTKNTSESLKASGGEVRKAQISEPVTSEGDYASSGDEHSNSTSSENEDLESDDSCREDDPKSEELKGLSKKLSKDSKGRDFDLDLSDGEDYDNQENTLLANTSKTSLKNDQSSSSSDSSQIEFDDERTWDDLGNVASLKGIYETNFATKEFIPSEYTSRSPTDAPDIAIRRKVAPKKRDQVQTATASAPDTPPASELMMKLFPALKPKVKPESQTVSKPAANQEGSGDAVRSQLLKEKLVELETEIERFKMENTSLARLREDKETALETLRKEVADFEQQKTKELARIEEYTKEEMKKLQKERKVFEKYASAARAMPDKKEREEIQTLKQQVRNLQEELKKKEAKWSTTHVRLRNQIEALLKENGELREEIKFMEKVRLETWKKAEAAEMKKKTSEGPTTHVRRSESVSPLHMFKQRRTSAPEPEKSTKILRSQSPIKGLASRSFRQSSLSDSSNSDATKFKNTEPAVSTAPQDSDKVLPTEQKNENTPVKENDAVQGEITYPDGKTEQILRNGTHVILFPNGTRKEVSGDGKSTTVTFFNGDVKQVMADQRVIYYYADAQTTHTTYPDGLEILQFSNGQIEKHFPDGRKEITFPDQTIKNLYPDGKEESIFPDGTIITTHLDGTKVIAFDNGQRELHTAQYKRREYPDGTVKTVYTNGQQETKYASGRVRVKDKDGKVIMDTKM
ncbi:centrosomal P4.1-associated protein [Mixophyes fleayi]|uniref:centrosomal P4.1-associated protein n=1 Tax=Mixophyes fleayi TaxID=3061075 RepID=UPI003F4D808A